MLFWIKLIYSDNKKLIYNIFLERKTKSYLILFNKLIIKWSNYENNFYNNN